MPVCKKAVEQGVVVVNIDNPLDPTLLERDNIDIPFIGPDNREGGRLIGEYVKRRLGSSGEVFIQKSQMGGGSPMIRGFSTNRILIVVDGVRMNNAIYRSGNLQNVISIDASTIENTEVIFGPGSVIYGSDAVGGVMSFNTILPRLSSVDEWEYSGNIMSRLSSANKEKTGHFDFQSEVKSGALLPV